MHYGIKKLFLLSVKKYKSCHFERTSRAARRREEKTYTTYIANFAYSIRFLFAPGAQPLRLIEMT